MRVSIYALVDPREPTAIRYVGQTVDERERLRRHVCVPERDKRTHRGHWLMELRRDGITPTMIVLARVDTRHRNEAERAMIRRLRNAGHLLVNGSDGGDGGRLTPELQAKATRTLRDGIRSGRITMPRMTTEQRTAHAARMRALRLISNPMKRADVRAKNAASQRARRKKTSCKYGHVYDAANTYVSSDGRRHCKACRAARARKRRASTAARRL